MVESTVKRLRSLPRVVVLGREVPIAIGLRPRLLGLSHLNREQAGPGLLIPRCSSVHTFGMRFSLDLYFLDAAGAIVVVKRGVSKRCLIGCRGAATVLELPSKD